MNNKRILIIHDDRLLTNLYREKLEGSGFDVSTARTPAQAQDSIATTRPDVVLLDLVLSEGCMVDFIKQLRCDSGTIELPLVAFSTGLSQLANAALQAGASKIITRCIHPVAATLDTVKVAAGLPGLGDTADAPLFQPDETWLTTLRDSCAEMVNQMRHCLPGLVSTPPDYKSLMVLWSLAHTYAAKAELLENKALACVAMAFDILMADLNDMPDQINQSSLRTVGQAIDYMSTLSMPEMMTRGADIAAAHVLVVDDEEGAREFITAAMQLAGVRNDCADNPARALEYLEKSPCDLIFLDVGMPQMNGFELCTRIRGIEAHKKTPIVFLTGMGTFQNKAQASLSGGNDFVSKPFTLPELALKALIWICRGQLGMV